MPVLCAQISFCIPPTHATAGASDTRVTGSVPSYAFSAESDVDPGDNPVELQGPAQGAQMTAARACPVMRVRIVYRGVQGCTEFT